jgi:hypothetical protein
MSSPYRTPAALPAPALPPPRAAVRRDEEELELVPAVAVVARPADDPGPRARIAAVVIGAIAGAVGAAIAVLAAHG